MQRLLGIAYLEDNIMREWTEKHIIEVIRDEIERWERKHGTS